MFHMKMTLLASLLFLGLAGCVVPVGGSSDGSDDIDVQVTAAGEARCMATSKGVNSIGAVATNMKRGEAGLPLVRPNQKLAQAAAAHACDMARRGRMTHAGSSTTGPSSRAKSFGYRPSLMAENIAAGPFDLEKVLNEWNTSPGHLKNILIPSLRDFGIGQAVGADGKTVFWAAVYGAPR